MIIGPGKDNAMEQAAVTNEHRPDGVAYFEGPGVGSALQHSDVTRLEQATLVRQYGQAYYNTEPALKPAIQTTFATWHDAEDIAVPADPDYPTYGQPAHDVTYPAGHRWDSETQIFFGNDDPDESGVHYRIILLGAKHNGSEYSYASALCFKKGESGAFVDGDLTEPPFFKLGEHAVQRCLWTDDMEDFATAAMPVSLSMTRLYQSLHAMRVRHLAKIKHDVADEPMGPRVAPFASVGYLTHGDLKEWDSSCEGVGFFGRAPTGAVLGYLPLQLPEADIYKPGAAQFWSPSFRDGTDGTQFSHAQISGYAAPVLFIPHVVPATRIPFDYAPNAEPSDSDAFYIPLGGASAWVDATAWDAIAKGAEYGLGPMANPCVPAGAAHTVYIDLFRAKVKKWKRTYYEAGHMEHWPRSPFDPPPPAPVFYPAPGGGYVDYPDDEGVTPVDDELLAEEWHDIIVPHVVFAPFEPH